MTIQIFVPERSGPEWTPKRGLHSAVRALVHFRMARTLIAFGHALGFRPLPATSAGARLRPIRHVMALLLAAVGSASANDFLIFPRASISRQYDQPGATPVNSVLAGMSLFYATDFERLRVLAEINLVRERKDGGVQRENEVERAQIGWRLDPHNTLWFGRYHSPIGYWNVEYHHGNYLQTGVSRPAIVEFEDDGGPLPIHLYGLLLQGTRATGDGSLTYELGTASGPRFESQLEPVALLHSQRFGKAALVARATWRPDAAGDNQFGAFAAHTRIPLADLPETELRQALGGIFANFEIGRWRGFGELFYVNNRFVDSAQSSRFIAGYAQAEYKLAPSWTVYGRLEATDATASDPYLSMFRDFPRTRQAGGVRFDVAPKHALTLEFAAAKPLDAARQRRVELQWSATIP